MSPRRRRVEAAAANRETVLRSARREFEASGYHGAALARIAEAAGFSEGVVYSQFGSKVDLFLAVLEASIEDRAAALEEAAGRASSPGEMHRIALAQSLGSLAWQATLVEFRVHAWRHPHVNARYHALHERAIENVARVVSVVAPDVDVEPRQVAVALLAGTVGITLEILADATLDPNAVLADLAQVTTIESSERTA